MSSIEIRGAKELASFLKQAPAQVALKAGKGGVAKSAPRLRTLLRRAAPKKSGKLRSIIRSKIGRKGAIAWVGLKTSAAGIYYTTEYGRKPHRRKGKPRAGSPQMAKHWFSKAYAAHRGYIAQLTVDATRSALMKEAGRLIAKTQAPVRIRRGF
jgi:hypothetical protein